MYFITNMNCRNISSNLLHLKHPFLSFTYPRYLLTKSAGIQLVDMPIITFRMYHITGSEFSVFCVTNYFSNKTGFFQEGKTRHYCKKQCTEAFKSPVKPPWKNIHTISYFQDKSSKGPVCLIKNRRALALIHLVFYSWYCKSLTEGHQSLLLKEEKNWSRSTH